MSCLYGTHITCFCFPLKLKCLCDRNTVFFFVLFFFAHHIIWRRDQLFSQDIPYLWNSDHILWELEAEMAFNKEESNLSEHENDITTYCAMFSFQLSEYTSIFCISAQDCPVGPTKLMFKIFKLCDTYFRNFWLKNEAGQTKQWQVLFRESSLKSIMMKKVCCTRFLSGAGYVYYKF